MASGKNGTLYIGVTRNLIKRVYEHKNNLVDGFTKQYNVHLLVYFEPFEDIKEAIQREKRIKHWRRHWKVKYIVDFNPELKDLYS
jgi:putative endonuclease